MFLALPMFSFSFQYLILQKVNIQNTWWSMDFSTLSNIEVKDNDCAVYFMFQLVFFYIFNFACRKHSFIKKFQFRNWKRPWKGLPCYSFVIKLFLVYDTVRLIKGYRFRILNFCTLDFRPGHRNEFLTLDNYWVWEFLEILWIVENLLEFEKIKIAYTWFVTQVQKSVWGRRQWLLQELDCSLSPFVGTSHQ